MSISLSLARRLAIAAAACSFVAATVPAQAAVVASFDPAFGPSIPNLGFRGSMTLDVTAGCYALGSGFHFTGGSCQINPLSAQINFYNTSSLSVLQTVNLLGSFFAPGYVFGGYFDPFSGQLAGLDTNDSTPFTVTVADGNPLAPVSYNGSMLLYFASGFASSGTIGRIAFAAAAPAATIPGVGAAFLVDCNPSSAAEASCASGNPATTSNPARLTFTTVPEPGSISLAVLGLVALGATRRRTRRASAGRSPAV